MIICLPGPPRELEPIFADRIIPYLKRRVTANLPIVSRVIKITGLAESQVNRIVKDLLMLKPPTTVGIYARLGEVDLKIMTKARSAKEAAANIGRIERIIRSRLGGYIFGYDDGTLEDAVAEALIEKGMTIAVAESCTGGLVSSRLTDVGGSSKYFICSTVTYSNESKENILAVPRRLIERHGAVSKETALAMAKGIKHFACVDIGLGATGIAGPAGGTKTKPVGLVYIAFVSDRKRLAKKFRFHGSRKDIKLQASQAALDLIRRNV
jgi:nicotinamide-nucleotide amidase